MITELLKGKYKVNDNEYSIDNSKSFCPEICDSHFSSNGRYIALTDDYGNLNVISLYDIDSIDALEDNLERIHSDAFTPNTVPPLSNSQMKELHDLLSNKTKVEKQILDRKVMI